jgi:hypothetical protein
VDGRIGEPARPRLRPDLLQDVLGEGLQVPGGVGEFHHAGDDEVEEFGGVTVRRKDGQLLDDIEVE